MSASVPAPAHTFEVEVADITQLDRINLLEQTFVASIFFQFRIHGGANDKDLALKDEKGRPSFEPVLNTQSETFRPPAGWYLEQFDINNSSDFRVLTKRVLFQDDDIILKWHVTGSFHENFELESFPFDVQALQICLTINCRTSGMTPVQIAISPNACANVVKRGFHAHAAYDGIHKAEPTDKESFADIRLESYAFGCGERIFPSLRVITLVKRKPWYYILNIMIPASSITAISFLQWAIDRGNPSDRLSVTVSMVLTMAAYKVAVTAMVPAISYLTLLDRYVFALGLLTMLITFEGGAIGLVSNASVAMLIDRAAFIAMLSAWCSIQVNFAGPFFNEWHSKQNATNMKLLGMKQGDLPHVNRAALMPTASVRLSQSIV